MMIDKKYALIIIDMQNDFVLLGAPHVSRALLPRFQVVMQKLGVTNRPQAVAVAAHRGLIDFC